MIPCVVGINHSRGFPDDSFLDFGVHLLDFWCAVKNWDRRAFGRLQAWTCNIKTWSDVHFLSFFVHCSLAVEQWLEEEVELGLLVVIIQ
jgi:hypothetical protein